MNGVQEHMKNKPFDLPELDAKTLMEANEFWASIKDAEHGESFTLSSTKLEKSSKRNSSVP